MFVLPNEPFLRKADKQSYLNMSELPHAFDDSHLELLYKIGFYV